jgi:predicted peptidase
MPYWARREIEAPPPRPLMVFLHGSGETGGAQQEQTAKHGPWSAANPDVAAELSEWARVGPHVAKQGATWNTADLVDLVRSFDAQPTEVIANELAVIGISRGGWGALDLVAACPPDIAVIAVIVFCPEKITSIEAALGRAPMLVFHCDTDTVVPLPPSRRAKYDALQQHSSFAWVNVHPTWTHGATRHNCWTEVLRQPAVYQWLRGLRADPAYRVTKNLWPDFSRFAQPRV